VLSALKPFQWTDVRTEADRILASAKAEALDLLARARAEAEGLAQTGKANAERAEAEARARGEAEGRAAGEKAGEAQAQAAFQERLEQELADTRTALAGIRNALKDVADRVARTAEAGTVALALGIAEVIVKREVRLDPALVSGNVRAAIQSMAIGSRISLRLHPEDKLLLEGRLPQILHDLVTEDRVTLQADPLVQRGGCVASTEGAEADATLEGQIVQIRKALLGEGSP
jgi:flagellar assembly protein FliH